MCLTPLCWAKTFQFTCFALRLARDLCVNDRLLSTPHLSELKTFVIRLFFPRADLFRNEKVTTRGIHIINEILLLRPPPFRHPASHPSLPVQPREEVKKEREKVKNINKTLFVIS
jgi:hypothetical protein